MNSIKFKLKSVLESAGIYLRFTDNLPVGLDWKRDINQRMSLTTNPIFFDVGANVGQTSRALLKRFPKATIHAFEPVSTTFAKLEANCSGIHRINTHNFALGSTRSTSIITNADNSLINSIVRDQGTDSVGATETIEVYPLDEFCSANNITQIDVLKSDTEGYDLQVLKGAESMLDDHSISCVVCESTLDSNDSTHSSFIEIYDYLSPKGYQCAAFYDLNNMFRDHQFGSYFDALFIDKTWLKQRD
ncbi:MAG: FkbM family methyltransferase [Phycisphaerales bacterium]